MGAGASVDGFMSVEAALAAGKTQEEIDAFLAEHPELKRDDSGDGSAQGSDDAAVPADAGGAAPSSDAATAADSIETTGAAAETATAAGSEPSPADEGTASKAEPAANTADPSTAEAGSGAAAEAGDGKGDSDPAETTTTEKQQQEQQQHGEQTMLAAQDAGVAAAPARVGGEAGADVSAAVVDAAADDDVADAAGSQEPKSIQKAAEEGAPAARDLPTSPVSTGETTYTEEERKELRDHFEEMDTDHSGLVHAKELAEHMIAHGIEDMTEEHVEEMMEIHDASSKGALSFSEFVAMLGPVFFPHAKTRRSRVQRSLRSLQSNRSMGSVDDLETTAFFELVDADSNGYVTIDELRAAWDGMDQHMSDQELQEMIDQGDLNKDGKINLKEFVRMFG